MKTIEPVAGGSAPGPRERERGAATHGTRPFPTPLDAVNYVLWKRARSRPFRAQPFRTVKVQVDPDDAPLLRYAVTRLTPQQWIDSADAEQLEWIRQIAEPITGPLVFAARCDVHGNCSPPIVVFEGYHHVAAWWASGHRYPDRCVLVMTEEAPLKQR